MDESSDRFDVSLVVLRSVLWWRCLRSAAAAFGLAALLWRALSMPWSSMRLRWVGMAASDSACSKCRVVVVLFKVQIIPSDILLQCRQLKFFLRSSEPSLRLVSTFSHLIGGLVAIRCEQRSCCQSL